jgi:hypothetical protein
MSTDWKALCAELVDEAIYLGSLPYEQDPEPDLIVRARAALAQPGPQGPSDEDLLALAQKLDDLPVQAPFAFARAALARWGRPAIEPVPVAERLPGPEDCDAEGRCWWLKQAANPEHDLLTPTWHLQRHGPAGSTFFKYTHWLPYYTLPVPTSDRPDTRRLRYLMENGPDGFTHVAMDRYDYAMQRAEQAGRDEPNEEDEFNGFRLLIDAAMAADALPVPQQQEVE